MKYDRFIEAIRDAYQRGFEATGEGRNAEHCPAHQRAVWEAQREADVTELIRIYLLGDQ